MSTPSDIVRLLEEYGVISAPLARESLDRLDSDSPPSLSTLLAEFHQAGFITEFLKEALEEGRVEDVQVSDHLLLNLIGRGGMGMVYRARTRVMHRDVAIKLMRTDVPRDESAHKRFLQEVRTAGELDHPHIVSAYHAGRHGDGYYLTMELVQGETLNHIVREHGPLGLRDALQLGIQICKGLEYAHENGFVHRDIKPANLLLDEQRQVKILDLGLSRRIAERDIGGEEGRGGEGSGKRSSRATTERLTESGSFIGTSTYMAPEQAEEPQNADHRADMYSLGCTLFLMMTGRPPYKEESGVKLLLAHRQAAIPTLREFRSDATPRIDSLLKRLLAKNPKDRPESYSEIIRDLKGCLESLKAPVLGLAEGDTDSDTMVLPPKTRPSENKPSSSGLHWIMAMIVLLLLSVAAWELFPWNRGDQERTVDAQSRVVSTEGLKGTPDIDNSQDTVEPEKAGVVWQPGPNPLPLSPLKPQEAGFVGDDRNRRLPFLIPPIGRGGTLRLAVHRRPSGGTGVLGTGPFIVSLPTESGRIHLSLDWRSGATGDYFVGFVGNRVAQRRSLAFALNKSPKTIAIVIHPNGIRLVHENSVFFEWIGDPNDLRPGASWAAGPLPYFSSQDDGRFSVTLLGWDAGLDEQGQPLSSGPLDD